MDQLEAYLYLFTDSLMSALLLPPKDILVFDVMRTFGGYNQFYMLILVVLGSACGCTLNYALGYIVRSCKIENRHSRNYDSISKLMRFFQAYGKYLLIFAALPLIGGVLSAFAGLNRINLMLFLILVTSSEIIYFAALHPLL
jgi:membrane protein YqaA with SNARE-associated domain